VEGLVFFLLYMKYVEVALQQFHIPSTSYYSDKNSYSIWIRERD